MKQANLSVILQEIKFTWQNTEPIMRPWGIWICCHKPIFNSTNEDDLFNTSIVKVWFGDRNKIIQKPKSEYLRFYFAQVLQPWCSCKIPESNSLFAREKYSIGLAHFAEIEDRDNYYYLHWQFAGCLGEAFTFKIDSQGQVGDRQPVFIS